MEWWDRKYFIATCHHPQLLTNCLKCTERIIRQGQHILPSQGTSCVFDTHPSPGMTRTTNGYLFLGSYTCHGVRSLISTGGALILKNNINTTLLFRKLPVFNANVYSLNSILSKFKKIQYFKHLDI